MSKPIFLSDEYIRSMTEEFKQNIGKSKMSDGKITFTKSFEYTGDNAAKAHLMFTPIAYIKMLSLLRGFDSEVAWHGIVSRKDKTAFIITDILVYPQTVSGATVNTDQEEYQKWTMTLEDDCFNAMRMQGHSHVNFSTNPSSVDITHQESILSQLSGQDFYIFVIFNKRLEHTIKIYDYPNNIMYEDKDVVVGIMGDRFDEESFISGAKKIVKPVSSASTSTNNNAGGYTGKTSGYGSYYSGGYSSGYGGGYTSGLYGGSNYYKNAESAKQTPAKKEAGSKTKKKYEDKAKAKRDKAPANASKKSSASQYPGYYAGVYSGTDWDKEIFGDHFDT